MVRLLPFYYDVTCTKFQGGKHALWHAKKPGHERLTGAGNTADNAIKDLQTQINRGTKK